MSNSNSRSFKSVYQMSVANKSMQIEMNSLHRDWVASGSNLIWAAMASLKAWDTVPSAYKDLWMTKFAENKAKAYSAPKVDVLPVEKAVEEHNIGCKIISRMQSMRECVDNSHSAPVRYNMRQVAMLYTKFMAQNLAYSRESLQEQLNNELAIIDKMTDQTLFVHYFNRLTQYQQAFKETAAKCQCHAVDDDTKMNEAFAEVGLYLTVDSDDMNDGTIKVPVSRQHYEGGY